ncbi:hypothetical protein RKD19_008273 [Streptomyces canus]
MTGMTCEADWGQWSGAADEKLLRGLDELRDEEAGVRGAGGDNDVTGLGLVDRNGDEAGAEGVTQVVGRGDGDGSPLGDGLKLVVVGVGEGGAEGGGVVVRAGFEPPEGGPVGTRAPVQPTSGSAEMSAVVTDSFPARRWNAGTSRTRGSA